MNASQSMIQRFKRYKRQPVTIIKNSRALSDIGEIMDNQVSLIPKSPLMVVGAPQALILSETGTVSSDWRTFYFEGLVDIDSDDKVNIGGDIYLGVLSGGDNFKIREFRYVEKGNFTRIYALIIKRKAAA